MHRTWRLQAAAILLGLTAALAPAAQVRPQSAPAFPVERYQLRNGLEVILAEDDSLPLVSVVVAYRVGSIHDAPGNSGLAYLMGNLMFQGSENISPMQHIHYIEKIGGEFNAMTDYDRTMFFQTAPSQHLALLLWLESDRMLSLSLSPASVERSREALIEENRQRLGGDPHLSGAQVFDRMLYGDYARAHPLSGTNEDLNRITYQDVAAFHRTFYVPNNAVICISGDFRAAKARELVARYFETIPRGLRGPTPPPPPYEAAAVSQTLTETLASTPGFHMGFRFSALQPGDIHTLGIIDYLLLQGRGSRLFRRLVRRDRLALYLSGGLEERAGVHAYRIFALVNNEVMAERSQKTIAGEINRLKTSLISETELRRAKNMFRADYLGRTSTSLDKAIYLVEHDFDGGTFSSPEDDLNNYMRVTPSMIVSAANRHFLSEKTVLLNIRIR
jgi:zinc protease